MPVASYFTIKISIPPAFVNVVVPKVMVGLKNKPVINTLPLASVQTPVLDSELVPPSDFAHCQFGVCAFTLKIELNSKQE